MLFPSASLSSLPIFRHIGETTTDPRSLVIKQQLSITILSCRWSVILGCRRMSSSSTDASCAWSPQSRPCVVCLFRSTQTYAKHLTRLHEYLKLRAYCICSFPPSAEHPPALVPVCRPPIQIVIDGRGSQAARHGHDRVPHTQGKQDARAVRTPWCKGCHASGQ